MNNAFFLRLRVLLLTLMAHSIGRINSRTGIYFHLDFSTPVSISPQLIGGYGLTNMPPVRSLEYHQRPLNSQSSMKFKMIEATYPTKQPPFPLQDNQIEITTIY